MRHEFRKYLIGTAGLTYTARAYDGVTQLLDLSPTVLDLLGLAAPSTFEGRSLLSAVNHADAEPPPAAYLEAMGRKIGFIPAAARLADPNREMPLLIYLAESPCSLEQLADQVNDKLRSAGRAIVVVSEGFDVGEIEIYRCQAAAIGGIVEPLTGSTTSEMNADSITCSTSCRAGHPKLTGPTSVKPCWSTTFAPRHNFSMSPRVAGMLPPGSPATTIFSTRDPDKSIFSSAATSASRMA